MDTTTVPIRSAWLSKINWTQAVGLGVTGAVLLGCNKCDLSAETQVALVVAIQSVQTAATMIFRTWFNGSVSPASLTKAAST